MEEQQEQAPERSFPPIRKGCQISLMFQCDSDDKALAIKKAIDDVLPDLENKRFTFQITEM